MGEFAFPTRVSPRSNTPILVDWEPFIDWDVPPRCGCNYSPAEEPEQPENSPQPDQQQEDDNAESLYSDDADDEDSFYDIPSIPSVPNSPEGDKNYRVTVNTAASAGVK